MIDTALEIVEASDVVSSLILLLILMFIGGKIVAEHPECVAAGRKAAVAVFVLYAGWRMSTANGIDAAGLTAISLRALLAAGFAVALAWIFLPVATHLRAFAVVALVRPASRLHAILTTARQTRSAERQAAAERERWQRDYRLAEPEREHARREAEEREARLAGEQRRREDARLVCRLRYDLAAPEIGIRFPREQFEKYVAEHMGDQYPAEQVERRSQQILDLLQQHVEKVEPSLPISSLPELTACYEQHLQDIEAIPDERLRETLLVELRSQYFNLAGQVLEKPVP